MRVIVCGGRDYRDRQHIWSTLDLWHKRHRFTAFMQGGHWEGVDRIAKEWARAQRDLDGKRYECKAEWKRYGKSAGPKRNSRMLDWKPDIVLAFPGDRGTADMVRKANDARARGLIALVVEIKAPLNKKAP